MSEPKRKASEAYLAKLRDPRWQKKRLEILQRDNFECYFCKDKESTLHVHHLKYEAGKDPWEYENYCLLTLCETCHEYERERPGIEQKLLESIRMAKIGALKLDAIACPSLLSAEQFEKIWGFAEFLFTSQMYQASFVSECFDEMKNFLLNSRKKSSSN